MTERETLVVDASRPNPARIYDYLLGGKDNYAADRDLAARLEAAAGEGAGVRELAKVNRRFVVKAAGWAATMMGIGQFLDLGSGLPSRPAVHEVARDSIDGARVVYVDNDPIVISHATALMGGPGLGAVLADASDPAKVLSDEAVSALLDFSRPVAVILGGTLSTMDLATAQAAVKAYAEALAPGSCIVISCASWSDPEAGERMAELYGVAGEWVNHSLADVESFFLAANLKLVRQRVADVRCWPMLPEETPDVAVIGGIGKLGGLL